MDYALLFHYLAVTSGLNAYYISDNTMCHAYNMVRIDGHNYLIDCTWDSGLSIQPDRFQYRYRKDYFLFDVSDNWRMHWN
jgi:transglutaminase/protease-like cytokinesis protein 3